MGLNDIILKNQYDSITDDVYDEFFNKILKYSTRYYRAGGRFTSKNFAACAEGLQEFIQRDGTMKLVLLPEFSEDDIDAINKGLRNAEDVLSERWIKDMSEIHEKFVEDHTKALAWMLAHEYLEIRIVVPTNRDGSISSKKLLDSHIFDNKTGIFSDGSNHVSFSGTIEFDDKVFGEYYYFRVYRSWIDGEKGYLDKDYEAFSDYWDGREIESDTILKTIPLPSAIKESIIKIAPASKSDIKLQKAQELRPYQKEAVRKWTDNNHRGILEMATGTGKTFTAIGCIDEIKRMGEPALVVIVCPSDNLERQWKKELEKWGYDATITSGNTEWSKTLRGQIAILERGSSDVMISITTYKTFSSDKFTKSIERCTAKTMLVSDEMHNAGSPMYANGLSEGYDYRLGLSATVERYYDDAGTITLREFFGDTVYEISLKRAIEDGFLVGYHYYPIYGDLNADEYEKYQVLTKRIAYLWSLEDIKNRQELEEALIKRARIIRDAESKIVRFTEWVKEHPENASYLLAYCSEKQILLVKDILKKYDKTYSEITSKYPPDPRDRAPIIEQFEKGAYDIIIANRVLDEGADIPAARNCIILSSTGNPKQFVQRRGRVLRKYGGTYKDGTKKDFANIYDVLIIPDISDRYTKDEIKTERQIVISQISRQIEMADAALNRESCMADIRRLAEKFSIKLDAGGHIDKAALEEERRPKNVKH